MPGQPSRTFELEIAPLLPRASKGVPGEDVAPPLKELLEAKRWERLFNRSVVPLGLRWRVTPAIGLPRVAFSVWRRDRRLGDPSDVAFNSDPGPSLPVGGGQLTQPSRP